MKLFVGLVAAFMSMVSGNRFEEPLDPSGCLSLSVKYTVSGPKPSDLPDVQPPMPQANGLNIYAETTADKMSPATQGALERVYVPNHSSNTVSVIDPKTHKVIQTINVGSGPEHIIPSWDLKTLWVANNANLTPNGSMTPIDAVTGEAGKTVPVNDPYNMYFAADGSAAIIVAEEFRRLELRDPHTMELKSMIETPNCKGINHADYSAALDFMVFTCEFTGKLMKIDVKEGKVLDELTLSRPHSMPQDVRLTPDGSMFMVTDMVNGGVYFIDAKDFKEVGFLRTGPGAHGLTISRDGKKVYVANRGSERIPDRPGKPGSISVLDFATLKIERTWLIPGGGSPDMGNLTADGKELWVSGRFDGQVYAINTESGAVTKIWVGIEPHGVAVWPQPGRFSLGHTGNMR